MAAPAEAASGSAVAPRLTCLAARGDRLMLGWSNGGLQVWDAIGGTKVAQLAAHRGAVAAVCAGEHGWLSLGADDGDALVFEGDELDCVDALHVSGGRDARLLAGDVFVLNAAGIEQISLATRRRQRIHCPTAERFLSRSGQHGMQLFRDGTWRRWDVCQRVIVGEAQPLDEPVVAAALDGDILLIAQSSGTIVAYHCQKPARAPWLVVRPRSSHQLLRDETHFARTLAEARVALDEERWVDAAGLVSRAASVAGYARSNALFGLRRRLAAASRRGAARGCLLRNALSTTAWKYGCLSDDGRLALCLDTHGQWLLWQVAEARPSVELHGGQAVDSVALSADGERAVTLARDGEVAIWEIRSASRITLDNARLLALAATAQVAVVAGETVRLFDLREEQYRPQPPSAQGLCCLAISRNGEHAIAGYDDGTLLQWRPREPQIQWRARGHAGPVSAVAVSDAGISLSAGLAAATPTADSAQICTWGPTGARLASRVGAAGQLGISAGGRLGIAAGAGQRAFLWDLASGSLCQRLDRASSVALSADASHALTCSGAGIRVWELNWERLS